MIEEDCNHCWMANSGRGGDPEFKLNRQMSLEPVMHAKCADCLDRTWFTKKQWEAIRQRTKSEAEHKLAEGKSESTPHL